MKFIALRRCPLLLATVFSGSLFFAPGASAQLIYSENFGRANGASGSVDPSTYNWSALGGTNSTVTSLSGNTTIFAVSANTGAPTNAPQVNAGTDLQGTNGLGLLFSTVNTPNYRYLLWTSEYSFNPADYTDLTFFWYGGNSQSSTQRLAVQVGGNWYATSNQIFNPPSGVAAGSEFAAEAGNTTVTFSTATWVNLTTVGSLQLGSNATLPSGNLTAFGVYSQFTTAGVNRIDTFQITAIPEPTTAVALLVAGGAGYFLIRRRRRA